jgi:hypothetical protein
MIIMRFTIRALLGMCVLGLFLDPGRSDAQELYGADFQAGQITIFSIDPVAGTMTPLVATGAPSLAGGISAFDPVGNRFFFMAGDLYTVDLDSGTVTNVSLGGVSPLLQFDSVAGQLYGADFSAGQITIFAINPLTGTMVPVVNTDATSLVGGISTFDAAGKRFFFMSSGSVLYTANVATGSFSSVNLGGAFPQLQFDQASGTLYGADFSAGHISIFVINPQTGTMSPVAATGAVSIAGGISAFDPATKRFFFISNGHLYTVNVVTGQVSSVSLGGANPLLQFDAMHAIPIPMLTKNSEFLFALAIAFIGFAILRSRLG